MASLFRSIGIKIFGVAVGLLLLMAAASVVSGVLSERVKREMSTLSESLFPLTITLAKLRSDVQDARLEIEERDLGVLGDQACRKAAAAEAVSGTRLVAEARRLHDHGARIAVMEGSKLMLARLSAVLEDIAYEHDKLDELMARQCAAPVGSDLEARINLETDAHALELFRKVSMASREIEAFVEAEARVVNRNQALALQANLILIAASVLVGVMLAWMVARGLTRPIVRLQAGARAVQEGRLDEDVPVTSADEIGDVTRAFNEMVAGLRAKEELKATFGQYVDPRVVAELTEGQSDRVSAGEKQTATVYFSDLAGFTTLSERLSPGAVVTLINAYFTEMSAPIRAHNGLIDKYIGDGIMAFWAPPFVEHGRQAQDACLAALEQFERLEAFRARVPDLLGVRRDAPDIRMRVGMATGDVVVGSIGSEIARSFTVMGDTANFGSRLEGANKAYGTQILIDEATRTMAGAAIEAREVDLMAVVGRSEPIRAFELAARAGELTADAAELFGLYAIALGHYRAGAWAKAEAGFHAALARDPDDGPSKVMLDRTLRLRAAPPEAWDGIWRLTEK